MQLPPLIQGWFYPFPTRPGTLYLILVVLFFVGWLAASVVTYAQRRRFFAGNGAMIGVATRFGPYAIIIGSIGIFFIIVRLVNFPYLSIRILLYLTVLAAIGFAAFIAYYLRFRYPARLAAVRAEEVRRRYVVPGDRKRKKRSRARG